MKKNPKHFCPSGLTLWNADHTRTYDNCVTDLMEKDPDSMTCKGTFGRCFNGTHNDIRVCLKFFKK